MATWIPLEIKEEDIELIKNGCKGYKRIDKFMCQRCGFTKIFIDGHTSQWNYCCNCGIKLEFGGENQ